MNPINTMLERAIALDIEWQRNPLNHASTLNKATMVYSQLRFLEGWPDQIAARLATLAAGVAMAIS